MLCTDFWSAHARYSVAELHWAASSFVTEEIKVRIFKKIKKKKKGERRARLGAARVMAEGGRAPYLSEDADGAGHAHLPDAHHRYLAAGHRAGGGHGGHQLLLQGRHGVLGRKAGVSTAGHDPTTAPTRYRPPSLPPPPRRPGAPDPRRPRTHRLCREQGDAEPCRRSARGPAMRDPQRKGRPPSSRAAPPPTAPGAGPSAIGGGGRRGGWGMRGHARRHRARGGACPAMGGILATGVSLRWGFL